MSNDCNKHHIHFRIDIRTQFCKICSSLIQYNLARSANQIIHNGAIPLFQHHILNKLTRTALFDRIKQIADPWTHHDDLKVTVVKKCNLKTSRWSTKTMHVPLCTFLWYWSCHIHNGQRKNCRFFICSSFIQIEKLYFNKKCTLVDSTCQFEQSTCVYKQEK